jgi:ferredoxin
VVLPYYLSCVEKCVCLSCGVQVIDAAWQVATRIMAGVGDLVQRTRMVKHRLGTRWLDDREVG